MSPPKEFQNHDDFRYEYWTKSWNKWRGEYISEEEKEFQNVWLLFSLCLNSFVSTNAEFVLVCKECSINKNAESHWNVWKSLCWAKRQEKKYLENRRHWEELECFTDVGNTFPVEIKFGDKSVRRGLLHLSITRLYKKCPPLLFRREIQRWDLSKAITSCNSSIFRKALHLHTTRLHWQGCLLRFRL